MQTAKVYDYTYDGSASPTYASSAYTYDTSGRVTQTTDTDNGGSPWQIVHQTAYIWNNAINTNVTEPNPPTGTYILARVAYHAVKDINGTTRYACSEHGYDGHAYTTGQNAGLTQGDLTSHSDFAAGCGNSGNGWAPSGPLTSTSTYDGYGNAITADDADANAGDARHLGCTNGSTQTLYSACAGYDLNFGALPIWDKNAANQIGYVNYAATTDATGGYGMWPTATRDPNGQTTTYAYDPLGRPTSLTLPGETAGDTTTSWTYTNWCAATGAQTPCVEVDQTQRVSGATGDTITARAFYDGDGRLVETRVPAPGGQDVVRYRYFEPSGHNVYASVAYFVTAYAGGPGSAAYSLPDSTQTGTIATYDGLGRTIETYDPLGDITTASFAVVYVAADTSYYEQVTLVDPLGRERASLTDAFGRDDYDESFTGTGTGGDPYSLSASTKYSYDYLGDVTQILHPDGVTKTTFAYDVAGRQTGLTDPDRGTESYTYDANGNPTKVVDARGSAGTVYADYDGLDRQLWRNTSNSPTGAYVTYSYDGGGGSPCTGTYLVGRLCKESFTGGPGNSLSGAYTYGYDARGALTSATETVGGAAYTVGQTYDDAGAPTTATYPDGEQVTTTYTQGWLGGLSTQQGSTTTTLLGAATYTGVGGAAGLVTQASLGNGTYTYQADYDLLLRPTTTLDTRTSDGLTEFSQTRNFNAAGQVTSLATTVPGQTDNQAFCYDDLGRLTWATSQTATGPCGAQNTAGTLTGAAYTQSYAYDTMDRLTSGPLGSYTYADGAHVHAATAIGPAGAPTWTASYDAAGNMTCRAPTSASTCAGGSPTGAPLAYDAEGQLVAWQNAPSAPTTTAGYLYDGEGNRVEQQVTSGGTTTSTVYVGGVEEVSTTGSQTTTTTYYYADGQRVALAVNGTFSYLASDGLGSANVALDASGTPQAVTLYAPYGTTRYTSGAMPGSYGYTGQHADAATGLDYYGARPYDPAAGQFTAADTLLAGLNRYGYVGGDPENATDPSGHACDSLEFASCLAPVDEGTEAPSAFRSGMRGHTLDPDYQDPAPAGTTGPPPLPSVPDPYPGLGVGGGYGPRTQPPGDDLQPFNQRTWAAARAAVDESNPLGPTENQQNLPKPTPPPPGPTPPSPSPGPTSTLTGGGSGDAPPGAPPAPPGDGCDDGGANPNTVTVYRVQGGGPTGSKPRIKIRFGKVLISGRDMLFLNFGNTERAMELLARRSAGGPAQIVAFEVAAEFVQWLRDNAVPEAVSKQFPGSPIAVDLNDGDQFGLPSTLFRRLFENMVPGSGHVLPNEETC